jgi:hypothetical protein
MSTNQENKGVFRIYQVNLMLIFSQSNQIIEYKDKTEGIPVYLRIKIELFK